MQLESWFSALIQFYQVNPFKKTWKLSRLITSTKEKPLNLFFILFGLFEAAALCPAQQEASHHYWSVFLSFLSFFFFFKHSNNGEHNVPVNQDSQKWITWQLNPWDHVATVNQNFKTIYFCPQPLYDLRQEQTWVVVEVQKCAMVD